MSPPTGAQPSSPSATGARERISAAAYELFSRGGVRGTGVDAIIERSGVARQTLYRQFASKQALALAFLRRREEEWTQAWLQTEVEARTADPAGRLLAVFDVFDEWFRRPGFEGCAFINVMLVHAEPDDPVRMECVECLPRIRAWLAAQGRAAGAPRGPRRPALRPARPWRPGAPSSGGARWWPRAKATRAPPAVGSIWAGC